ncbi:MAG: phosphatase PAP2 family protein [Bacteroidetes bacterium]|nr:phosphatase PAP2 family protein [Bacteroidota bacterium]
MDTLLELDRRLLLFLNGLHHPMVDSFMYYASQTVVWLPLYLLLIFLIFKKYKSDGWYVLAGAAITILLADQITSSLMKPFFARLRPSQEPSLIGLVHLVNGYKGGLFGFASSHAANTFGTALFVWFMLKPFYKKIVWLFLWAALMSYTRIYLGVHYPGDILVGAMVGLLSGWIGFRCSIWLISRYGRTQLISY